MLSQHLPKQYYKKIKENKQDAHPTQLAKLSIFVAPLFFRPGVSAVLRGENHFRLVVRLPPASFRQFTAGGSTPRRPAECTSGRGAALPPARSASLVSPCSPHSSVGPRAALTAPPCLCTPTLDQGHLTLYPMGSQSGGLQNFF